MKSKVSITAPISTYGREIEIILAMTIYGSSGTTNYYYLKDLSNTVLALANSSGSIVESYDYDAYGNVTIRNGSGNVIPVSAYGNRFLFQGREYDYTTQLYHFRARWYDPETGRWLSNDPIGISGGLNLYAFCNNDPVNFVDPMGLDVFFCRSLVPGGHAWVKIGGKKYNTNGDTGTSYGGYPSELFGGKPMLIESPDEHENDWFVFYRRYETTPEVENELENWIKKTYYIEGSTSEDECERNKNPIYDLFSYNCRDFSESIEYQLNMILFPPTPLMNRRNFLPLIDLPKF